MFYTLLLTMTVPALCLHQKSEDNSHKDQRQVLALSAYAGLEVAPLVWAALVSAYGLAALALHNITRRPTCIHF